MQRKVRKVMGRIRGQKTEEHTVVMQSPCEKECTVSHKCEKQRPYRSVEMNIQGAIKKAGPGGKIRRESADSSVPSWIVPDSNVGELVREDGSDHLIKLSNMLLLTADDWEVVEPEPVIEVGDVVLPKNGTREHKVIHIHNGNLWVVNPDGGCYCNSAFGFTLIRKGPKKHVFEGVGNAWGSEAKEAWQIIANGQARGQTYRITLEEME
jgi:hypothetical protein